MLDITGDMGIDRFMREIGFHDNRIITISFVNGDAEIQLDDLFANIHNDGDRKAPGSIIVRNCNRINCVGSVSDWIVNGQYWVTQDSCSLELNLNMGTNIFFGGTGVEIHEDKLA
jgi:hypothetical protein